MGGGWEKRNMGETRGRGKMKAKPSDKICSNRSFRKSWPEKKNENPPCPDRSLFISSLCHTGCRPSPPARRTILLQAPNCIKSMLARDVSINYTRMQSTVYRSAQEGFVQSATNPVSLSLIFRRYQNILTRGTGESTSMPSFRNR